mgnify:FL=1
MTERASLLDAALSGGLSLAIRTLPIGARLKVGKIPNGTWRGSLKLSTGEVGFTAKAFDYRLHSYVRQQLHIAFDPDSYSEVFFEDGGMDTATGQVVRVDGLLGESGVLRLFVWLQHASPQTDLSTETLVGRLVDMTRPAPDDLTLYHG